VLLSWQWCCALAAAPLGLGEQGGGLRRGQNVSMKDPGTVGKRMVSRYFSALRSYAKRGMADS